MTYLNIIFMINLIINCLTINKQLTEEHIKKPYTKVNFQTVYESKKFRLNCVEYSDDNIKIILSNDGLAQTHSDESEILGLDKNKNIIWKYPSNIFAFENFAKYNDNIYLVYYDSSFSSSALVCFNAYSGDIVFKTVMDNNYISNYLANIVIEEDYVIIGYSDNDKYVSYFDKNNGKFIKNTKVDSYYLKNISNNENHYTNYVSIQNKDHSVKFISSRNIKNNVSNLFLNDEIILDDFQYNFYEKNKIWCKSNNQLLLYSLDTGDSIKKINLINTYGDAFYIEGGLIITTYIDKKNYLIFNDVLYTNIADIGKSTVAEITEDKYIYSDNEYLICKSIKNNNIIWKYALNNDSDKIWDIVINEDLVYIQCSINIYVFDLNSGKLLYTYDVSGNNSVFYSISLARDFFKIYKKDDIIFIPCNYKLLKTSF